MVLTGLFTALITPFRDNVPDLVSLKKLVDAQIEAEVDGLVVLGTTGEAATIDDEERAMLISVVVEYASHKLKVIVGSGSNSTKTTIKYTKQAKELGADAVLITAPYHNKPTAEGVFQHYQAVSAHVDIPMILYNIPSRTGINIADETITKIAGLPSLIGLKDSTGDLERPLTLNNLLKGLGKEFSQLSGEDTTVVAFNAHGGRGAISVTANIAPKLCKQIQMLALTGKYAEALALQQNLLHLHQAMFCETNPAPVKYAAYVLDLVESYEVRLPLVPLSEESQRLVLNAVNEIKGLL